MPGPPPKRSAQRRRRNKGDDVDTAVSDGEVRGPELKGAHCVAAKEWYQALRASGQAQFFEPSDWAQAKIVVLAIDEFVKSRSASLLGQILSASSSLLVTEGDRRRLRVELERAEPDDGSGDGNVSWLEDARRRAGSA
jgi:hypothetical protein